MHVSYTNNRFVCHCDYSQKDLPKSAGFWWDRDAKVWFSTRIKPVLSLINNHNVTVTIDDNAKKVLNNYNLSSACMADVTDDILIPQGLALRGYQVAGVRYILDNDRALLADPMGLGKTIQAIVAVNTLVEKHNLAKVLVVCPAIMKLNWLSEFTTWLVHDADINIVNATKLKTYYHSGGSDKHVSVTIINYDLLQNRLQHVDTNWDVIIFDEAHYLKNPKAKRTKIAEKLSKLSRRVIFLTGTPLTKNPIDLFPMLRMSGHPIAKNWLYYAKRYCDAEQVRIKGHLVWQFSSSNEAELQEILRATFMCRRKKESVLTELPPKQRHVIMLPADILSGEIEEEQAILKAHKIKIEDIELDEFGLPSIAALANIRQRIALKKTKYIAEFVEDILDEKEKVVIFAWHKSVVDVIHSELKPRFSVGRITGETPQEHRQVLIDRFQRGDLRVLIISIAAGGVGITLTAADTAVFAELDWIPANIEQAEDRIHRIGQQSDSVNIYYVVVEKTLENYIAARMAQRQRRNAMVTDQVESRGK